MSEVGWHGRFMSLTRYLRQRGTGWSAGGGVFVLSGTALRVPGLVLPEDMDRWLAARPAANEAAACEVEA